jgi:hypothetical protein
MTAPTSPANRQPPTANYFFELLTEEIPAWMHAAAIATLRERLSALSLGTSSNDVTVNATSRRIIFLLKNLPLREEDRVQEVKGPPKKSPEAALQGFLKKQNATADDIIPSADEYIRIRKTTPAATRATSSPDPRHRRVDPLAEDAGQRRTFVHPPHSPVISMSKANISRSRPRHAVRYDDRRPSHAALQRFGVGSYTD